MLKHAKKGDEGYELRYFLPGHSAKIKEASEPSDIIWENRSFTKRQRSWKRIAGYCIIGLALLISFQIMFYGTKWQVSVYNKFPPITECQKYHDQFQGELEHFAITDYKLNIERERKWETVKYSGHLQCYCELQAEAGVPPDYEYGKEKIKICEEF